MKKVPRILIVEDSPELLRFLSEGLQARGYEICTATTFNEAIHHVDNETFDLAILDIMLDKAGDGIGILKYIRESRSYTVPIIIQTVLADDDYCVRCLHLGADDFVIKPIRINPLVARIEAVLRRVTGITPPGDAELPLRNGAKAYCSNRKIVLSTGTTISLSYKEAQLLRFFSEHPGETLSAENLLLNVWNISPTEDHLRCVRSSISRLRVKLEDLAEIKAYYGEGYRFEA